jgi:hypothetical protein
MIKPRRTRGAENVAYMGEKRSSYRVFTGEPEETNL